MKKFISVLIAVSLCVSVAALLSSCGKNAISNSDFKTVEEAFDAVNFVDVLDKKNISSFAASNESEDSDNTIYNDVKDDTGFILNKENKKVVVTGFVIKDALYKDIDGDGVQEVYASGYNSHRNSTTAALYDYTKSLLITDENGEYSDVMELIAEASFEGDVNIGFYEDNDGNVHVVSKDITTGEVADDYGVATVNGLLLEIGDYNNISKKTDNPTTDCFVTDKYTYYFNGKEFKPESDFAYGEEGIVPPVSYIDKVAFEELTGLKYKSLGDDFDSRAIMVINGKEYVSWFTLNQNYDIERKMGGNLESVIFNTLDYTEKTSVSSAE